MITTVECPFCHIDSDPAKTGGYCDDCGRRLPESARFVHKHRKERVVREDGDEPVARARHRTAEALFTAAVLRLIVGGGFLVIGPVFLPEVPKFFLPAVMLVTVGGTASFALAGLLAYRSPFPASAVALAGFVAAWAALLAVFPPGWPLAAVDIILLGWLIRAAAIGRAERV
ncbi:MAG: hypothetical protein ACRC33_11750 [Gemmataceae bacterium]